MNNTSSRSFHCPVCNWFLARIGKIVPGTQPFNIQCRCPKCKVDRRMTVKLDTQIGSSIKKLA